MAGEFDAGVIKGRMDLETGEFEVKLEGIEGKTKSMTQSMFDAQVGFAIFEKGFQAITGLVKDSIGAWTEQEDVMAQTAARLKATGGACGYTAQQLYDMSSAIQESTVYTDDQALAMENMLLTFDQISGKTFPAATSAIIDMSAAMGTDLSTAAMQVGRALQDPANSLQMLRRAGIQFSSSQKETIKNLMDVGEVGQAQAIILDELNSRFKGAAAAAKGTLGGALKSLKNDFEEGQEAIGKALAPALQGLIAIIKPVVQGIASLDKGTIQIALGFVGAAVAIFGAVKAFQALKTSFAGGIGPLQGVLIALAAIGGAVAVINEVMERQRTIHKETADQYVKEYSTIDGLVTKYETLKNQESLSGDQKIELAKTEDILQKQLGQTSMFLNTQTGRWEVNAEAVSKYKGERLDLAKKELAAQVAVQERDKKHAEDRDKAFKKWQELRKDGDNLASNAYLSWMKLTYQFGAFDDALTMSLYNEKELGKTTDDLAASQKALNALTTGGVEGYNKYQSTLKDTSSEVKDLTGDVNDNRDSLKAFTDAQKRADEQLRLSSLNAYQQELAQLDAQKAEYERLKLDQKRIDEWYLQQKQKLIEKYGTAEEQAAREAAEKIQKEYEKAIGGVTAVINTAVTATQMAWSGISNIWDQALQAEQTKLENEYGTRKAYIEASVADETDRQAALEALDKEYAAKKADLQKKQWIAQQANAVTSAIMNTATGVTAALALGPILGPIMAVIVGALGAVQIGMILAQPMPEFAKGGSPPVGAPSLVGEQGPEMFVPTQPGHIYTAAQTRDMLGRGGVHITVQGDIKSDVDLVRVMQLAGTRYRATMRGAA